jgi:UDP-N-acetylglucosamine 4-epimerase
VIYGDGEQTRDFTFVENAVQANIRALFTTNNEALNRVYNVAVSEAVSVNDLYQTIATIAGNNKQPEYVAERKGDIKNSLADISLAVKYLGYAPRYKYKDGLSITVNWFKNTYNNA